MRSRGIFYSQNYLSVFQPMKSIILALLIILPSLLVAQPKLQIIGGDTYNWGKVKYNGKPLTATISLKNAGNQPLKISQVKPGCGCTTAPLDKSYLKPGEKANISVSLNTGKSSGDLVKGITIYSNDPNIPMKALTLRAFIMKPLQILPNEYIAFPDIKNGGTSESKSLIKNVSNKPITISNFLTSEGVTINLSKNVVIPAGDAIELKAKAKPKSKGYWNGSIRFMTNSNELPMMEIIVYGNVI